MDRSFSLLESFHGMSSDSQSCGFVEPQTLYTLSFFKKKMGISDSTLRAARSQGLKVRRVHKKGYIYGADWIAYVLGITTSQSNETLKLSLANNQVGTSQDFKSSIEVSNV